jgi:tRNA (guanine37-N1)-methyltransferase
MTPKGRIWNQARAAELANAGDNYILICPHYEGYDERILTLVDYQVSIGKFILTGGELPAMTVIDSIVRLIPGVLGGETSAEIESFSDGDNYEYPQYTRPAEFRGMKVPEVLLNGNHGEIAKWRAANAPTETQE